MPHMHCVSCGLLFEKHLLNYVKQGKVITYSTSYSAFLLIFVVMHEKGTKGRLSSPLPSWDMCISMGKLPKSEDFQRSTDLSPSPDSKTPICSLWRTVAPAVQKQLWRGFRVMLLEEILTIDWISKAKSLRSCPAKWLLHFFPSPSPSLSFSPAGLLYLV